MTATQAQDYEAHGNKVAMTFIGGALSTGIAGATLPTTALENTSPGNTSRKLNL